MRGIAQTEEKVFNLHLKRRRPDCSVSVKPTTITNGGFDVGKGLDSAVLKKEENNLKTTQLLDRLAPQKAVPSGLEGIFQ